MSEIKFLVLTNYNIPLPILDQILKNECIRSNRCEQSIKLTDDDLYDVISFPSLCKILADKNLTFEKNYFIYVINKMFILHPTIEHLIFVFPHKKSSLIFEKVFSYLENKKSLHFLFFPKPKNNDCHISFYDSKNIYNISCQPILNFICSDGRLSKIYNNSLKNEKNPFETNFGYSIRLPGSTLWSTLSEDRKILIDLIYQKIIKNNINEIIIDHHGPDCGAFCSYHRIENINANIDYDRCKRQHKENIEKVWEIFSKIDSVKNNIRARYHEFNNHFIKEYSYCMTHSSNLEFALSRNCGEFDFKRYEFTEKIAILT